MSDVVGTSACNEPFNFNSVNASNTQEQEVNDLYEVLKLKRNQYVQYKIVYDALEECISEDSDLDQSLKTKVADILLSGNVAQSLSLDEFDSKQSTTLLGFNSITQPELNYIERNELQTVLKSKLDNKYKNIHEEFRKLTNKDISKAFESSPNCTPLQISSDDKALLEYRNKLLLEQEQYVDNLLNLQEILKEISNLRLQKLPQMAEQKIKECQLEEKMNHLKSLLIQQKVRVDVFTETTSSLKAYKELIRDIKEQQKECEKEIEELKALKEKYNKVSCKQYDEILKSYLQYKSSIEKKKLLYNCLKS